LKSNNYKELRRFINWKQKINKQWDEISVIDIQALNDSGSLYLGEPFAIEVVLNLDGIDSSDVGVELVFAKRSEGDGLKIQQSVELPLVEEKNHKAVYKGTANISFSGAFKYGLRYFPKNSLLNHRRDLPLVKWI
jgi:glycogen phosphorylase